MYMQCNLRQLPTLREEIVNGLVGIESLAGDRIAGEQGVSVAVVELQWSVEVGLDASLLLH